MSCYESESDMKDEEACYRDVNTATVLTVLSKKSFIEFLSWTDICLNCAKWLTYDIKGFNSDSEFAVELEINKSLASFYKTDFDNLMTILGLVTPEFEIVCQQCKTKMEKNFDVSASCPKCGLERLEKVPVQKRERIV